MLQQWAGQNFPVDLGSKLRLELHQKFQGTVIVL